MCNQNHFNVSLNHTLKETFSIDQLMDSLGFDAWKTLTAIFVIPAINLIGIILCSLSGWIFFKKTFKDPVFFYFRLLCIIYIIHLLHNIPSGLAFFIRYFPQMNTYFNSFYLIYYTNVSDFLFHYEETLQMAILLTRMKIYNSCVSKHFSSQPWVISLAFFLTCFLIDFPSSPFNLNVNSIGTYYYYDTSNCIRYNVVNFYDFNRQSLTNPISL